MDPFPTECLRGRATAEEFLQDFPRKSDWLKDLQAGDELWRYAFEGEAGGESGYVVLRDGVEVKIERSVIWDCAAPQFFILWEGERPSLREMLAVRQMDPYLRDKPIGEVRKRLEGMPYWSLGDAWSSNRPELEEHAKRLGLRYELRRCR